MDTFCFLSHEDLAEYMGEKALDGKTVVAALLYNDAKKLLKELLCFEDTHVESIDLSAPIWKGYNKEFYVTIDSALGIDIQEAWHESNEYNKEGYYKLDNSYDIALIASDANSRIVKACECACYCAEVEIDADAFCECDECCLTCDQAEDFMDIVEYLFEHIFEE